MTSLASVSFSQLLVRCRLDVGGVYIGGVPEAAGRQAGVIGGDVVFARLDLPDRVEVTHAPFASRLYIPGAEDLRCLES